MPAVGVVDARNGIGQVASDWAMDIADWKGFEARRREAAKRGKLLGRHRAWQACDGFFPLRIGSGRTADGH